MIRIKGTKKEIEELLKQFHFTKMPEGSFITWHGIDFYLEPSLEVKSEKDLRLPPAVVDFIFSNRVDSCDTNEDKLQKLEDWVKRQEMEADGWYLDSYGNWQKKYGDY